MSFLDNNDPQTPLGAGGAGLPDIATQMKLNGQNMAANLTLLIAAISGKAFGTFTLSAAASTVVPQPAVASNSVIVPIPLNAAAATLMGSAKALYISARAVGVSFTVATASGGSAAGTEQFSYMIYGPT